MYSFERTSSYLYNMISDYSNERDNIEYESRKIPEYRRNIESYGISIWLFLKKYEKMLDILDDVADQLNDYRKELDRLKEERNNNILLFNYDLDTNQIGGIAC